MVLSGVLSLPIRLREANRYIRLAGGRLRLTREPRIDPMIDLLMYKLSQLALHEIAVILVYPAFWLWMIIDCKRYEPRKVLWMIILFIPLGVCAYYIRRVKRRLKAADDRG